jgi:hypothetical protein
MYDTFPAMVLRERMMLKPVDEPRLMSERRMQITPTRMSAGNGTWRVGWTYN